MQTDNISFSYEVVDVDTAAKCMTVKFMSPGLQTFTIGARLPSVGESLETVLYQCAPIPQWLLETSEVSEVIVGSSGELSFNVIANMPTSDVAAEAAADAAVQSATDYLASQNAQPNTVL